MSTPTTRAPSTRNLTEYGSLLRPANINQDADLFQGDENYHLLSRDEVFDSLVAQLGSGPTDEAITNTVLLAERCTARLSGNPTPPIYSQTGGPDMDTGRLLDMCFSQWKIKVQGKPRPESEYIARFEREMKLLVAKQLCGYFDIVADYCLWAKRQGILVGPGRGSGGASLVAYLSGITEIDPVEPSCLSSAS